MNIGCFITFWIGQLQIAVETLFADILSDSQNFATVMKYAILIMQYS